MEKVISRLGGQTRHCRHCWGRCLGDCLFPDGMGCIHSAPPLGLPFWARVRLLGTRRFWHRVLHGTR